MVKEGADEGAWWPCVDASGLVEHWWLPSRYALRSLVGRGTYGVCAKVWCAETDTVYVVKRVQLLVPRREMKMTGRLASWAVIALRRTLREVAVLRRLRDAGRHRPAAATTVLTRIASMPLPGVDANSKTFAAWLGLGVRNYQRCCARTLR